jgi:hypothetical protein
VIPSLVITSILTTTLIEILITDVDNKCLLQPSANDQCSFERLCKALSWLQYEPKHVADVVCSHQYLTYCV